MARLQAVGCASRGWSARAGRGQGPRRPHKRRGVLILVVLSLLTIFALLLIAFVSMTSQSRRALEAGLGNQDQDAADVARTQLNDTAAQLICGSTNRLSAIGQQSLLEDMYGNNTVGPYTVTALGFTAAGPSDPPPPPPLLPSYGQILNITAATLPPTVAARRVGCVLTVINPPTSPAALLSFRIVGYNAAAGYLQLWNNKFGDPNFPLPVLSVGDQFIINGTPFSGPGQGFNPITGHSDLPYTADTTDPRNTWPVALLPRLFTSDLDYGAWATLQSKVTSPPPGAIDGPTLINAIGTQQLNEDYDAADYQNMFLATMLPTGVTLLPSFHRPELVNYWMTNFTAQWNNNAGGVNSLGAQLRRKVLLRPVGPMGIGATPDTSGVLPDHPYFTGSNPNPNGFFDPVNGPWDVDNDGDGIPDSIWVDPGFPVASTKDGRAYKTLVAILCVDLDGRLNVNAHGDAAQADSATGGAYYYGAINPTAPQWKLWAGNSYIFSGGATPVLPRGMGSGPADVNLLPLFGGYTPAGLTAYWNFLSDPVNSRYAPGGLSVFGPYGRDAALEASKWYEYSPLDTAGAYHAWWDWQLPPAPLNPFPVNYSGAYGSPPNRLADGAVGIDPGGRPIYCAMGRGTEHLADPYKLNLVQSTTANSPFTVAELERLLRQYDSDAPRLPPRLATPFGLQGEARIVTTDSWDVPGPTFKMPEWLRALVQADLAVSTSAPVRAWLMARLPAHRAQDILAVRYYMSRPHSNDTERATATSDTDTWMGTNTTVLLPMELLAGRKMDVNRAFGNGRDDNGNGIVDEPAEATLGEPLVQYNANGTTYPVPFNHTDQPGDPLPATARQLYARYLYILALMAIDDSYYPAWISPADTPAQKQMARARWLAQWAVNVVDFRDRDSIMTRFDYDPSPFGGPATTWSPTQTVWGCERPELLITETLATHDRRALNSDNSAIPSPGNYKWTAGQNVTNPPPQWDPDFDQTVRPEGSLFVELYNPSPALEPRPAELTGSTVGGVRLDKTTPNGDPVWRMVIAAGSDATKDPDDPVATNQPTILRSVYFAQRPTGATYQGEGPAGQQYMPDSTILGAGLQSISPGQYAIVGPGVQLNGQGNYVTFFGRLKQATTEGDPTTWTQTDVQATRRIELNPAAPIGCPVLSNSDSEPAAGTIQPVVSVVIDQAGGGPHRLNISEPNDHYATISGTNPLPADHPWDYGRSYDPVNDPFSKPLPDSQGGTPVNPVLRNGTTPQVAVIYLQRLADPTQPYSAVANPFRTIDSAMIDLVAFNGWDDPDVSPGPNQMASPVQTGTVMFATNQRGTKNTAADGANNIWVQHMYSVSPLVATPPETATNANYFGYNLQHSLGYLNTTYTTSRLTSGPNMGDPAGTPALPWLTWSNRPYVSPMELLMVPSASSSRLLNTAITTPDVPTNSYGINGPSLYAVSTPSPGPFSHLVNFCEWNSITASAPRLYQILDFLGTPSPFVGTDVSTEFQANTTALANSADLHTLYPPFHLAASYRDPGRINLNTIVSPDVWAGLMNDVNPTTWTLGGATVFQNFAYSRRGYTGGNWYDASNPAYPTRFGNPFRSSTGADLNPVPPPLLAPAGPGSIKEVNGTLLRPDPSNPSVPLLGFDAGRFPGAVADCDDPTRNPFFSYRPLARLGNLATTRSNLYAVWITLGYFQAVINPDPKNPTQQLIDVGHPDGYQLTIELGSDTGNVVRHRAFYIIDRSIPVGFSPGQNYNTGNVIRLMRYLQ